MKTYTEFNEFDKNIRNKSDSKEQKVKKFSGSTTMNTMIFVNLIFIKGYLHKRRLTQ